MQDFASFGGTRGGPAFWAGPLEGNGMMRFEESAGAAQLGDLDLEEDLHAASVALLLVGAKVFFVGDVGRAGGGIGELVGRAGSEGFLVNLGGELGDGAVAVAGEDAILVALGDPVGGGGFRLVGAGARGGFGNGGDDEGKDADRDEDGGKRFHWFKEVWFTGKTRGTRRYAG